MKDTEPFHITESGYTEAWRTLRQLGAPLEELLDDEETGEAPMKIIKCLVLCAAALHFAELGEWPTTSLIERELSPDHQWHKEEPNVSPA